MEMIVSREILPQEMFSMDHTILTQSLTAAFLTAMDDIGDVQAVIDRLSAELEAADPTSHPMMPTCIEMSKRILTGIHEFVEDSIELRVDQLVSKSYDPDIVEAFSGGRRQVDLQRLAADRAEFTGWLATNESVVDDWVRHTSSDGTFCVPGITLPRRLEYRLRKYINTRYRDQKIVVAFLEDNMVILTRDS